MPFWKRAPAPSRPTVCVTAILRDELPFIDEWIAYHHLLGVKRFYLYDDDPAFPLREHCKPYGSLVEVIDWYGKSDSLEGRNRQTKAYLDSIKRIGTGFDWVIFLDVDEFIVLREHESVSDFLSKFDKVGAVSLNWHCFGHNGHFNDPKGLVTEALTRRGLEPGRMMKTFNRLEAIENIDSAHFCHLKRGYTRVDPQGQKHTEQGYPGRSATAHVNHYMCRSFRRWMKRVARGDVAYDRDSAPSTDRWKVDEERCLRQFVETIAKDKNEFVDEYMLRFKGSITSYLDSIGRAPREG